MAAAPVFDLKGRTALVTGASSGLGARFARILSASGANVVLAARRADRLDALKAELEAAGGRAIAVSLDVTDEASTIAAYDAAEAAFGTVDTIIANAGGNSEEGLALDVGVEGFDETLRVNLRGVFLTAREGARRLVAAGSAEKENGRVVIIGSLTAFDVSAGLAAYSASKAGVVQMGKVLAREWMRQGINVNMICPGWIRTEINAEWFESAGGQKQITKFPRRRLMHESDLDVPMLYLASDASRSVTGSVFTIDDGQAM